jgi:leader peptidase (prepilin peptidase)/N-methyltransferase
MLFAPSLGSFYFTLGERILLYFYGKERKNFSYFKKWLEIFTISSQCNRCKKNISFLALIPILGFFLTQKKCPYCQYFISWIYPFCEFLFLVFFLICFVLTKNFFFSISFLFLLGHILISMITDYKKLILDYENLLFLLFFGVLSNYFYENKFFSKENFFVGVSFLGFYVLLYILKPNAIGFGDVLYAPSYAFLIGHPFWMLFLNFSYVLAVFYYGILKILGKNPSKKIPMGFFFGLGFVLSFCIKIILNFL